MNGRQVAVDVVEPSSADSKATIDLGLVVTPALDEAEVEKLTAEVAEVLAQRYPDTKWQISSAREFLVTPPAGLSEIVDAARSRLLDENWDLVVYITELPLRVARRPLLTHSSPTHGAALVSLPALGPLPNRRLADAVAEAVGVLAGDTVRGDHPDGSRHGRLVRRRLNALASELEGAESLEGVALLHRVVTGDVRLLAGMVRANHPWRLATRLSRALVGALGVTAFSIITADVWRMAASLAWPRIAAVCVATIGICVVTLIAAHGLWERAPDYRVREQAILFNLVTLITVAFGIATLYGAVFVLGLLGAGLMLEPSVMAAAIGHRVDFGDYIRLALLAGALATVGGAIGGALESDAAVREATYAYRRSGA